ncbi:MAG: 50S ribosomal protein L10 [Clostridia bacterium]|nr:50S ribosomal protein L10 [Clostridia bacterium]
MPSEKVLQQKQQIVADLSEKLKTAAAGVFVDYCGLTVEEDTELRNKLREAGIEYAVVKNTLTKRAANEAGFSEFDEILNGPTALALSFDDVVAPARVLAEFAKTKDVFEIKAGFMEGRAMSLEEIDALSKIPSKDTLYAMLAGGLNSVIAGLARAIDAVREQKETA